MTRVSLVFKDGTTQQIVTPATVRIDANPRRPHHLWIGGEDYGPIGLLQSVEFTPARLSPPEPEAPDHYAESGRGPHD